MTGQRGVLQGLDVGRHEPVALMLLSLGSPWLAEFARALAGQLNLTVYSPVVSWVGCVRKAERLARLPGCETLVRCFPIQRGYFSKTLTRFVGEDTRILRRLESGCPRPGAVPLVLSLPHYARVAERWTGPVIYYATDLFRCYANWDHEYIRSLESKLCRRAELVCPNSHRIAAMFTQDYGCDASKIHVIPNGVRSENLLANPSIKAATMPRDTADLERPVAGVIGNLGANTDWVMVEEAVKRTPWLSWLFVGPYTDVIKTPEQAQARMRLLKSEQDRLRFVGRKDAGALRDYARGVDVAVLPYRKVEPTFSGSSTRFYEHLAAGRPMISTRGFEELLHKEPLLKLVDNADELVDALTRLRSSGFQDGLGRMRWEASRRETWDVRAREMVERIARLALPAGVGIERCRP